MSITIRYAESDADIVAIHRFLCVVAGPMLPGKIDHKDSATEVWRVVKDSVALMAMNDDNLMVGTMGIVRPEYWWNASLHFLANRWLFAIPGPREAKPRTRKTKILAQASNLQPPLFDKRRERLVILNKSKMRQEAPDVFRK